MGVAPWSLIEYCPWENSFRLSTADFDVMTISVSDYQFSLEIGN